MAAQHAGLVGLVEADPDLGAALDQDELSAAKRIARAGSISVGRGAWDPRRDPLVAKATFGLLVLDGVLSRKVEVAGRRSLELLAAGDVPCPLLGEDDEGASMRRRTCWRVVVPARMAILDDDLVSGLAGLTGMLSELHRRAVRRSWWLALHLALLSEPTLGSRLQLLLWCLADRWGRRRTDGVVIELPLTHEMIADLAGADRSAATRKLGELSSLGLIERRQGLFLLPGTPPRPSSIS